MRKSQYTRTTLELQLQRTVVRSTAITKSFKYLFSAGAAAATAWFIYRLTALQVTILMQRSTSPSTFSKIARLQRLSLGYLE